MVEKQAGEMAGALHPENPFGVSSPSHINLRSNERNALWWFSKLRGYPKAMVKHKEDKKWITKMEEEDITEVVIGSYISVRRGQVWK